jgi:hypothetical protein
MTIIGSYAGQRGPDYRILAGLHRRRIGFSRVGYGQRATSCAFTAWRFQAIGWES